MSSYGFHPEALLETRRPLSIICERRLPEWQRPSSWPLNRPLMASLRLRLSGGSSRNRAFVGMSSDVFPSFSTITGKHGSALPSTRSCTAAANQATGGTESPNLAHALAAARGRRLHFRDPWRSASDAPRWVAQTVTSSRTGWARFDGRAPGNAPGFRRLIRSSKRIRPALWLR